MGFGVFFSSFGSVRDCGIDGDGKIAITFSVLFCLSYITETQTSRMMSQVWILNDACVSVVYKEKCSNIEFIPTLQSRLQHSKLRGVVGI